MQGLEAGAADFVQGHGRYRVRQAGLDCGLARRVLPGTSGQHLAKDHFIDQLGIDTGQGQQLANHRSAEVNGGNGGQRSLVATDSGSGGGNDNNILHGAGPHYYSIWRQNSTGPCGALINRHGGIDARGIANGEPLGRLQ
ncbi:hypothetical protein D3C78_961920 [compost metagenome]